MTVFSDEMEEILKGYQTWLEDNGLGEEDVWYADIFDFETLSHLYSLKFARGGIAAIAAPEDSDVKLFRRRRTLRQILAVKIRSIGERMYRKAWEVEK